MPSVACCICNLATPDTLTRDKGPVPSAVGLTHLNASLPLIVNVTVPDDGPRGCAALVLETIAVKVTCG